MAAADGRISSDDATRRKTMAQDYKRALVSAMGFPVSGTAADGPQVGADGKPYLTTKAARSPALDLQTLSAWIGQYDANYDPAVHSDQGRAEYYRLADANRNLVHWLDGQAAQAIDASIGGFVRFGASTAIAPVGFADMAYSLYSGEITLQQLLAGGTVGIAAGLVLHKPIGAVTGSFGAADNLVATGGRKSIPYWDHNAAELAYDVVRADPSDIASIARNTGMPEWRISRIKDHVFFKEHQLDDGLMRFQADPEMANAWSRLVSGNHVSSDVKLLQHEIFEAKFEGIFKTNYRTAHDAAIRSGRVWIPGE